MRTDSSDKSLFIVVVDGPDESVTDVLRRAGYDPVVCKSPSEVAPRAASARPDVVLVDGALDVDAAALSLELDVPVIVCDGATSAGVNIERIRRDAVVARLEALAHREPPWSDLRRRAEDVLAGRMRVQDEPVVHELRVHQIELEMQNEELRRTRREVELARDRWMGLFRFAPVGYVTIDEHGLIVAVNETLETMLSLGSSTVHGRPLSDLVHRDDRHVFLSRLRGFLKSPADKAIELRLVAGDGREVHATLRGTRVEPGSSPPGVGGHVLVAILDVTELRRVQSRLAVSERTHETIVENLPIGMALVAPDLSMRQVNTAMLRWFFEGERAGLPIQCDGLVCHGGAGPCEPCPVRATFDDRGTHERTVRRKVRGKDTTLQIRSSPVIGEDGRVEYAVLMVEDTTEKDALRQQVAQAQKMEAVGQLAGGVAHDLNNSLQAVLGNVELALTGLGADDEAGEDHEEALKAGRRASELIRHLLAFSRRQLMRRKPIDLHEHLPAMLDIVRRLQPATMRVEWQAGEVDAVVNADPIPIEQVVLNICINARDAMPNGGVLRVSTKVVDLTPKDIAGEAGVRPGPFLALTFEDEGHGIAPEHLKNVFEPFFTTKPQGEGSGLGLAVAYGIVRQHEGLLRVESTQERGATFTVLLPLVSSSPPKAPSSNDATVPIGLGERVLVVDDEVGVRRVIARHLERAGYDVLEASDGVEALALLEREDARIRVVLADLVMPNLGGAELLAEVRRRDLRVGFVVMTGYGSDATENGLPPDTAMLEKPYTKAALLRVIRRQIEAG